MRSINIIFTTWRRCDSAVLLPFLSLKSQEYEQKFSQSTLECRGTLPHLANCIFVYLSHSKIISLYEINIVPLRYFLPNIFGYFELIEVQIVKYTLIKFLHEEWKTKLSVYTDELIYFHTHKKYAAT